jgi:hypothetical protein
MDQPDTFTEANLVCHNLLLTPVFWVVLGINMLGKLYSQSNHKFNVTVNLVELSIAVTDSSVNSPSPQSHLFKM